ncbi:uncharacterized protein PAC_01126 [Phialocephala subalpina]|uniref:Uncharacterized protein n=1 Tax=Phialocephala subalpina TaxID=576137 RepID=A0A1L7WEP8_9HELO|nr:uncharacterized protein PAC_01126 [Phialocephala subalpina]
MPSPSLKPNEKKTIKVAAGVNVIEMDGHRFYSPSSVDSSKQFNGNVGKDIAPEKHLFNSPLASGNSVQVNGNTSEAAFAAALK